MQKTDHIWPKVITVDKRIVETLSVSTYQNFPKALREIIINGYDANASSVKVNIDEKNEKIEVVDNGIGMDEDDFEFYLRIAARTRKKSDQNKGDRKVIGKFGVGFLAVFPFCLQYEIESTKQGSEEILYASIPTEQ
ncbi:ATP-binding protein [Dolichospermum sp. ST_sed3]|nr:ATP-binding protein [Dolichospermum sp. ST_sed3]